MSYVSKTVAHAMPCENVKNEIIIIIMVKGNPLVIEVGVVTGFGPSSQGCCWLHWLKREGQNINHDQSK